ncbi:hypothetical protein CCZ27_12990 [Thauera sinica]|nr:hypothetical protein CCZ27_12990 [Thauera sp. K11]
MPADGAEGNGFQTVGAGGVAAGSPAALPDAEKAGNAGGSAMAQPQAIAGDADTPRARIMGSTASTTAAAAGEAAGDSGFAVPGADGRADIGPDAVQVALAGTLAAAGITEVDRQAGGKRKKPAGDVGGFPFYTGVCRPRCRPDHMRAIIASPNAEQPTSVAPSIRRAKS